MALIPIDLLWCCFVSVDLTLNPNPNTCEVPSRSGMVHVQTSCVVVGIGSVDVANRLNCGQNAD